MVNRIILPNKFSLKFNNSPLNPFAPNAPFPLSVFSGVEKECIENKWIKGSSKMIDVAPSNVIYVYVLVIDHW